MSNGTQNALDGKLTNTVDVVTVCVDYADLLSITLPYMTKCGNVTVITTPTDTATRELVEATPGVKLHETMVFYDDGHQFNKAKALGEVIRDLPGWILTLDADMIVEGIPLHWLQWAVMREDCIYSCKRGNIEDYEGYQQFLAGNRKFPLIVMKRSRQGWYCGITRRPTALAGYFQLFHASQVPPGPYPMGTEYDTASMYDVWWAVKWPLSNRKNLPGCVYHLGMIKQNWTGRQTIAFNDAMKA